MKLSNKIFTCKVKNLKSASAEWHMAQTLFFNKTDGLRGTKIK